MKTISVKDFQKSLFSHLKDAPLVVTSRGIPKWKVVTFDENDSNVVVTSSIQPQEEVVTEEKTETYFEQPKKLWCEGDNGNCIKQPVELIEVEYEDEDGNYVKRMAKLCKFHV